MDKILFEVYEIFNQYKPYIITDKICDLYHIYQFPLIRTIHASTGMSLKHAYASKAKPLI